MGRLFDAASALLGLGDYSSFEGQGPMLLEALLDKASYTRQPSSQSLPLISNFITVPSEGKGGGDKKLLQLTGQNYYLCY